VNTASWNPAMEDGFLTVTVTSQKTCDCQVVGVLRILDGSVFIERVGQFSVRIDREPLALDHQCDDLLLRPTTF